MADASPTPALPSTTDAAPYVPVSWMAVGGVIAAALFLLLLTVLGGSAAFKDRKPLIMPSLLILAGVGIVLSFAARRMIRNSEGTRTGENLANVAWWVCVVGGLGYTTYLFAIEYTIQRDAKEELRRWMEQLNQGDFEAGFVKTVDPGLRAKAGSDSPAVLIERNRDAYVAFTQLDIVRLAARNPGAIRFEPKSLRDYRYNPGTIECVFTGTVRCPEGTFPAEMGLRGTEGLVGTEGGGVRRWFIEPRQNGLLQTRSATLTEYGWRVLEVEDSGAKFGIQFLMAVRDGRAFHPILYQMTIHPTANREFWRTLPFLFQLWGTIGWIPPGALACTPDYLAHSWGKFLRLPPGTDDAEKLQERFQTIWDTTGIVGAGRPNGGRLPSNENIDGHALVSFTDTAIEVRVPCELPAVGTGGEYAASRGRVVVVCDDPGAVAELKRVRAAAEGSAETPTRPPDFRARVYQWRVVAIESDMRVVSASPMGPPGGPGGPPGG
jgi:hypothetical protein